ncbi:radical SAM protein [Venenivibrio stagnispumantis]|uniref:Wyosine [tRNA(Phe)-imidazoG37] synthetase, radical SAM superfamily n=1 Tax=Venenivibrio stagnispumantis TaxID=407998 RepID=A0AA45WK66_9AQUI|nr:radical SAM protein [Venenivibrio stagnispumantis]MCW4573942.1 radical SAM protein [Venenivibrio stagnispumantis]SMP05828.1 Wyosine [tRNA(Phe)-imidazoG37] synthetase, radical SAM superfamily [Venenivibrio stagnispumantis]
MIYIFGPVKSRRFGISLGIDLSPDKKSCNFDCLYCELEKAKPVSKIENEPPVEDIIKEVKEFLSKNPYPDVITVTANGEPTLYSKLEELIDKLNQIKNGSKTLILSNGSTINNPNVRKALKKFDIVKLSLDAADEKTFRKVDKPLKGISIADIIKGMEEFRKEYNGLLIIEILVVKNVNDTEENIKNISEVLKRIKPDRVDIGTIDRPPAYRVYPVSNEELYHLASLIEGQNVVVVSRKNESVPKFSLTKEDIINTLKKRAYTKDDIEGLLDENSKKNFLELLKEGEIKEEEEMGVIFYRVK